MKKVQFLTIFTTYGNLNVVKKTLPTVLEETRKNDAALIVYDSTDDDQQDQKWSYLRSLDNVFLILSTNLSVALARNTSLYLGQQMFLPEYISVLDDDHGYKPGFIESATDAMRTYYGRVSPNGLRFGLFTGCGKHRPDKRLPLSGTKHTFPDERCKPGNLGGTNGCFRCAPTSHWNNVLQGWAVDEYLISLYQTNTVNRRNYNRGFTTLIIDDGTKGLHLNTTGRGTSNKSGLLWDNKFTASDRRAKYKKT
jgi:glycosyltransferase involved in cell wall biosynthesis